VTASAVETLPTSAAPQSPAAWSDAERAGTLLNGEVLTLAYATVQSSGISDWVQDLTTKPRGRKQRGLTTIDVLAACIALSLTGRAPQFRAIAELLHRDMPAADRRARGIHRPWPDASTPQAAARRMKRAAEEAVRRRFESLAQALDAYDGPRDHRMEIGDLLHIAEQRTATDPDGTVAAAKRQQLLRLMNGLVQGTFDLVPSDLLGQMGNAFAIDGTFTPTWAAGPQGHRSYARAVKAVAAVTSKNTNRSAMTSTDREAALLTAVERTADAVVAADPEAGWYVRTEADGREEVKGFGYEAHLAVVSDAEGQTGRTSFPSLVLGLSIDTPSFRPGPNAIEVSTYVKNWGATRSFDFKIGVFDALYPGLGVPDYHRPLRQLGVMPVYRLRKDQLGSSGVTHEGASLVEGSWYCSEMPKPLVGASKDRIDDKIDEQTYQQRLDQRERWRMYPVSGTDALDRNGQPKDHRYECPSSRRGATVTCERDTSGSPSTDPKSGLPLIPLPVKRDADQPVVSKGPAACSQRTFQIPASLGTGIEQAHPYMSPKWRALNNRFRSTNEGKNGSVKDPNAERIGTKGVRRVNGMAANGILLACQIAASNLRATKNFLIAAELDDDGRLVRRYTKRGSRPVPGSSGPTRPTGTRATPSKRPAGPSTGRRASARTRA